jgi:RimJ/RimL family protein N-acetyltransferase
VARYHPANIHPPKGRPMSPLSPRLPDEVLHLRETLPLKPAAVPLRGQVVTLKPLVLERDLAALHALSDGREIVRGDRTIAPYDAELLIWRYMFEGPFESADALGAHLQAQLDAPNGLPYTVFDNATDQPVGVANYLNNSPRDLKIELGSIWYSPIAQRTHANLDTTHLLTGHAFQLGYRRVEWKCHAHNQRSRRSALRMGFTFEGVQEQHMIVKGTSRDTAWFRVLAHEWPQVSAHQRALLAQTF